MHVLRWLPTFLPPLLLLTACPENEEGFLFTLTKMDVPGSRQPVTGNDLPLLPCGAQKAGNRPALQTGDFDLRFTFLRRKPGNVTSANIRDGYELICWRAVKKGTKADFLIRRTGGESVTGKVTVIVEALRDDKLAYIGRREGLTIEHDSQAAIFMRPTIEETAVYVEKETELKKKGQSGALSSVGFSCLDSPRGQQPRAFHSATLLPNGEVFIYGGIAGASGDVIAGSQAVAVGTAEIFRPNYGSGVNQDSNFSVVSTNLPPRAFHHTFLLPSPPDGPDYKLLVIGGLQPNEAGGQTDPVVQVGTPFMFTPYKGATAGTALLLTYTPSSGKVTYKELSALPRSMFPAVARRGNLLALGGGAQVWNASPTGFIGSKYLQLIDLTETPTARTPPAAMANLRVKHAMAILGADTYVMVGGQMDGDDDRQGEYLASGATSLTPFAFSINSVKDPSLSTIAHTLTPIGATDAEMAGGNPPQEALLAGGFPLGPLSGGLRDTSARPQLLPQATALHRLSASALSSPESAATVVPTTDSGGALLPGHFTSAGHHSAVSLHNGGVLLTGGKLGQELQSCGVESPFCASDQVVIYDKTLTLKTPAIQDASWRLFVPRMGHRMTRLLDNTILITGGITLKKSTAEGQVLATPELFNPRTGDATEELFTRELSAVCEEREGGEG